MVTTLLTPIAIHCTWMGSILLILQSHVLNYRKRKITHFLKMSTSLNMYFKKIFAMMLPLRGTRMF